MFDSIFYIIYNIEQYQKHLRNEYFKYINTMVNDCYFKLAYYDRDTNKLNFIYNYDSLWGILYCIMMRGNIFLLKRDFFSTSNICNKNGRYVFLGSYFKDNVVTHTLLNCNMSQHKDDIIYCIVNEKDDNKFCDATSFLTKILSKINNELKLTYAEIYHCIHSYMEKANFRFSEDINVYILNADFTESVYKGNDIV